MQFEQVFKVAAAAAAAAAASPCECCSSMCKSQVVHLAYQYLSSSQNNACKSKRSSSQATTGAAAPQCAQCRPDRHEHSCMHQTILECNKYMEVACWLHCRVCRQTDPVAHTARAPRLRMHSSSNSLTHRCVKPHSSCTCLVVPCQLRAAVGWALQQSFTWQRVLRSTSQKEHCFASSARTVKAIANRRR